MQVLIDADNVGPSRVQPVLAAVAAMPARVSLVVSGRAEALARMSWPPGARIIVATGWQRADLALAEAYSHDEDPLILVSGDGDFALLAARHTGPVLIVSSAPSYRLTVSATVTDPALEGPGTLQAWVRAVSG
ncbi:MAG: hypothetical protein H0V67_01855 [Geodermatophilaceae bacterium]|nr:hypothetical protein [Geodermatophilaceae bacterium]